MPQKVDKVVRRTSTCYRDGCQNAPTQGDMPYCSRECRKAAQSGQRRCTCIQCGRPFSREFNIFANFCSAECRRGYNEAHPITKDEQKRIAVEKAWLAKGQGGPRL